MLKYFKTTGGSLTHMQSHTVDWPLQPNWSLYRWDQNQIYNRHVSGKSDSLARLESSCFLLYKIGMH